MLTRVLTKCSLGAYYGGMDWVDSMTGCRVLRANEIAINGSVL